MQCVQIEDALRSAVLGHGQRAIDLRIPSERIGVCLRADAPPATTTAAELDEDRPCAARTAQLDPVTALLFSPDGRRVLVAYQGGNLQLWDVRSGKPVADFRGHEPWTEGALCEAALLARRLGLRMDPSWEPGALKPSCSAIRPNSTRRIVVDVRRNAGTISDTDSSAVVHVHGPGALELDAETKAV
jgi:hypothetical protein